MRSRTTPRSSSTCEAAEQGRVSGGGGGGGKGAGQGEHDQRTRPVHRAGPGAPNGLARVRQVARQDKEARFTALLHHVDVDRLRAAYRAIRPAAAPGVDGVTWEAYGQDLEANLQDLHRRLHAGSYRANLVVPASRAAGGGPRQPRAASGRFDASQTSRVMLNAPAGRRLSADRLKNQNFTTLGESSTAQPVYPLSTAQPVYPLKSILNATPAPWLM